MPEFEIEFEMILFPMLHDPVTALPLVVSCRFIPLTEPVFPSPVTSDPVQPQVQARLVGDVQKPELLMLELQLHVGLLPLHDESGVLIFLTGKVEAKVFGAPSVKNKITRRFDRLPRGVVGTELSWFLACQNPSPKLVLPLKLKL